MKVRSADVAGETIAQPETGSALRTRVEPRRSRSPTCRTGRCCSSLASASIVGALGVFPSHPLIVSLLRRPLFPFLSFSFSFSLGPPVSLSLQGSTRSITTTRATYVRAHTLENGRPFISHPTGERTPTNRTLPRAKTSNRTRPSVQRKRGERALRRGGAGRGEMKKSFRIKTGKQKNNQISAYIINEDMCVRACVLVTAPVEGGLGC